MHFWLFGLDFFKVTDDVSYSAKMLKKCTASSKLKALQLEKRFSLSLASSEGKWAFMLEKNASSFQVLSFSGEVHFF